VEFALRSTTRIQRALLALIWLAACAPKSPLADVSSAAAAHLTTFARLERWTSRLASSDVRLRGNAALREAMFAPFRADTEVLWADVRAGDQLLRYEKPIDAAQLRYVSIDAPALGRMWVALTDECEAPVRARSKHHVPTAVACVVLTRPDHAGRADDTPALRIAFRRVPSVASSKLAAR
jgi:ABC-type transport system involved in cytochrome bd biosynthesis fused ATPase/permease subunit